MREYPIVLTDGDANQLRHLLRPTRSAPVRDQAHLGALRSELARAHIVPSGELPEDVVAIDRHVEIRDLDTGRSSELTLVLPAHADVAQQRISVLAPLGTALLGYRVGDEVEWEMPGGARRLRISAVSPPRGAAYAPRRPVPAAEAAMAAVP